ncbi:HAMP domain-containing sensor histidine kinase [Sphingomonas nostoxanthinifaciens]|uniref:HAMP domain-containing sensor histidine kinase n=1 Tax=Sphingomonas nostoxanthinifaciens TaxID=2872652 RepID=UPI001CC1DE0B|nr:HAMP domain-containing sensor histidine kinase [Sphingomonas nostoxanthinifaciens]UAK25922.1 HAMP domain-containing histidine kinase [Sphingomonas nostoxanthinifaciens]
MARSAALRIALAYSLAFALAIALLGVTVYWTAHHALRGQLDDRISAEMSSLISEYRQEGEAGLRDVIARRETARATNDMGYGLFARDGRRIAGAIPAGPPTRGWQTLAMHDLSDDADPARALAVDIAPGRRLVVAADWDALDRTDHLILSLLAAALAATILIGTGGAILLANFIRRRLAIIAGTAEGIMAGDLSQRIPLGPRNDEFDRLAALLNAMLDRITALLENLKQVSSDLAHDLRQPLTRLRNQLEQGLESGQSERSLERAIEQTDQVLGLFGSLLRLSEIEAGKLRQAFGNVDLGRLAADLGESYCPAIEDGGRAFVADVEETPPLAGDRELLSQALINLLDNAQIHTPPGTAIRLKVETLPDRIRITLSDDGPGVAPEDRVRIVGRFTRLDASRHVPGHGLGLSLVSAIATIHGGSLRFEDNHPGLAAILEFPR